MLPSHIPDVFYTRCFRRYLALLLIIALYAVVPPALSAQEAPAGDTAQDSQESQEAPDSREAPEDYLRKTLLMDIRTASYYELQEWLSRLGLSIDGDKEELQNRLIEHYGESFPDLSVEESRKTEDEREKRRARELTVEDAGALRYLSEAETGEAEIRLSGGVLVYMRDEENNATHRVEANSLTFNRDQARLTAEGSVVYSMEQGERLEEFTGEKISFNVENYHGIFIGGMSSRERTVQGESLSFYFKGEVIHRPRKDSVFFDEGIISSSTPEDPYYHVATNRLWVLAPDEWAFSDALLYMGRVPVFYFPFFFHPGDDLVFHPSFGYRSKEGYYFQTTTYLLGRKRSEGRNENSLSFLQIVEEDSSFYAQERHGIFLRQTDEPLENEWIQRSESHVKLLFDYYSRLGLFSGVDAEINDVGPLKSFSADLGVGMTDYIFPLSGYESYTVFQQNESATGYRRYSQSPWFMGSTIPYRFALNIENRLEWERLVWQLKIPLYSDPYFYQRFEQRDEEILWGSLIQGEELASYSDDPLRNPEFLSHFNYRFPVPETWLLLTSLSIDRFDTSLAMNDADIPSGYTDYPADRQPVNELGFYYPELVTPIDSAITFRGTFFDTGREPAYSGDQERSGESDEYRPPWREDEAEAEERAVERETARREEEELRRPPEHGNSTEYRREAPKIYLHSLDYLINPELTYSSRFDDEQMNDPSSVDFDPRFSYVNTAGYGLLTYESRFFGPYLVARNELSFNGRYREHYREDEEVDLSSYRRQDKILSNFTIDEKLTMKSYFLDEYENYDKTNLAYTFDARYLTYSFDEEKENYDAQYLEWDKEYVNTHQLRMDLIRDVRNERENLYLQGALPPTTPDNIGGFGARRGPFEGEIRFRSRKDEMENEWIHGPLDSTAKLNLWEQSYLLEELHLMIPEEDDYSHSDVTLSFFEGSLSAGQTYDWNIAEERPEKAKSSLSLWFFTGELEYRYMPNYEFDFTKGGWIEKNSSAFQPYRTTAKIDARYQPDPVWKNRIRLDAGLTTAFHMDMQRFTDNVLGITFELDAYVAEFFDVELSLNSENRAIYSYVPSYADRLGIERKDPARDFLRSLNLFDSEDLLSTNYNLKSLSLRTIHHMHDWQLSFIYNGEPVLEEMNKKYQWESEFTILVQWKPIPEIRKEAVYDGESENEEEGLLF